MILGIVGCFYIQSSIKIENTYPSGAMNMMTIVYNWLKWRTSRDRVRRRAQRAMRRQGEHAFLHVQACAWRAHGRGAAAEARFWEAVAVEISRRIQRQAILTKIMAPSTRPPVPDEAPAAEPAEPPCAQPTRCDHVYLVHYRPGTLPTASPSPRRRSGRRTPPGLERPSRRG
jgi:hypothetical protein